MPAEGWAQPVDETLTSASFGQRLVAYLLDLLIVGVPSIVIVFAVILSVPTEFVPCDEGLCEEPTDSGWTAIYLSLLAIFLLQVLYWTLLEGASGRTLGKRMLGIQTVDLQTGSVIGYGRAAGRYAVRLLFAFLLWIPSLIDHLWMLWDDRDQTLHDKAVRSRVVRA